MKTSGYYRRRRGILEHIEDGRISMLDNSFHDVLCQIAGHGTGIAYTSAARLARRFNLSRQLVHKYLIRLERGRYIRRFRKARSSATQIIWIHRYECTGLPQKGKVLNAWASDDCRFPVYEAVDSRVDSEVDSGVDTGGLYPYVQEVKKLRSKKKPAATPAAPPLPAQVTETEQRRRIGERDARLARARESYREAMVGQGPELDLRRFCAACGRTELFHSRKIENIRLSDPKWVPHEFVPETSPEARVDTVVDSGAQVALARGAEDNIQPIARARDIGIAAAAAAGAGPVDRAAPQAPMPITRARESTSASGSGLQSGAREKPGPQPIETMTKAEIDAELRALKAKLASVGNMR